MNTPRRQQGGTSSPLGRAPRGVALRTSGSNPSAVGFDPLADAGQGPAQQRSQLGDFLLSPVQSQPQLRLGVGAPTRHLGYIALPPYVGWVQLFPRIVLPNTDPVPITALPLRVALYNGPSPLPPPQDDTADLVTWLTNSATPIHAQFSVTLESPTSFIFGTPFSDTSPVFLPSGINVAVFQGVTNDNAFGVIDTCWCYLTAIAAPRNEQLLLPPGHVTP